MIDVAETPLSPVRFSADASRSRQGGRAHGDEGPSGSADEVIDLLARGAWEEAHVIVQSDKSAEAAWLHGIVHTIEGDLENARHWYRKAKRTFPGPEAVEAEIAAARQRLGLTRA